MKTDGSTGVWVFGLTWGVSFIGARLYLEQPDLPLEMRLLASLGPSLPFAGFLWSAVRAFRGADEMERRIQVEALATAFGLSILLVATLALAQKADLLSPDDWSYVHIMPMMVTFYLVGSILSRRRYAWKPE